MAFEDTLLKVSRKYTDSELVGLARKRNQELSVQIGKLKSYIAELEDKIEDFEKSRLSPQQIGQFKTKGWVKEILETEYITELKRQIKSLSDDNRAKRYKKLYIEWRDKYCDLLVKHQKLQKLD